MPLAVLPIQMLYQRYNLEERESLQQQRDKGGRDKDLYRIVQIYEENLYCI